MSHTNRNYVIDLSKEMYAFSTSCKESREDILKMDPVLAKLLQTAVDSLDAVQVYVKRRVEAEAIATHMQGKADEVKIVVDPTTGPIDIIRPRLPTTFLGNKLGWPKGWHIHGVPNVVYCCLDKDHVRQGLVLEEGDIIYLTGEPGWTLCREHAEAHGAPPLVEDSMRCPAQCRCAFVNGKRYTVPTCKAFHHSNPVGTANEAHTVFEHG